MTQKELLDALWPDTFVQPEVLKNQVVEVRTALGDNAKSPVFIETLARRGYRFIKNVTEAGQRSISEPSRQTPIIGREQELEKLHGCLQQARGGERQVVFVTGEAGIGKTTLADAFIKEARERAAGILIARGQSVEGYGVQEPYSPVLVALAAVLQEKQERLVPLLESHAPTWLVQFPGLLKPEHRQLLQREILGATRGRMARELCDLLPLISTEETLLLVLEDIHWADAATIELIASMAHSRTPAKLLVLATYRLVEVVLSQHPLKSVKQELALRSLCHELSLEPLGEAAVERYLASRSPGHSLPQGLARTMHRVSEGNPLFLRAALDHLLARGHVSCTEAGWEIHVPLAGIEREVPESLRRMLELQVDRLSDDERRVLEVASVCGVSFLANIAASAGDMDLEIYEEVCQKLGQRLQIVRIEGVEHLPGGAVTLRCKFIHAFYRQAIYDRLPPQRRSRLHARVGQALEMFHSETSHGNPSELALHFEAGGEWKRAAKYLQWAAGSKGQRFAYREAASDLEHALELLGRLPAVEGAEAEMEVRQKLGAIYFALEDFPASISILETVAGRAALAKDSGAEIDVLIQMGIILGRTSAAKAAGIARRLFALCEQEENAVTRAGAKMGALMLRLIAGESQEGDAQQFDATLAEVRSRLDQRSLAAHTMEYSMFQLFSSQYQHSVRNLEASLPALIEAGDIRHRGALMMLLLGLVFSGDWGRALRVAQGAVATAQKNGNHPRKYALLLCQAMPHLFANDWTGTLELCESALPVLQDPDQALFLHQGLAFGGAALTGLGRYEAAARYLEQGREGMEAQPADFDWYWRMPLRSALTELSLQSGDLEQARDEARRFVETSLATQERTWQALAWEASARVALAGSELQHGREYIRKAIAVMEGVDVPLAFWRVHATAMQLFAENAEEHRRLSESGILRLAESLKDFPHLQHIFLSSESVRGVRASRFAADPPRPDIPIAKQIARSAS